MKICGNRRRGVRSKWKQMETKWKQTEANAEFTEVWMDPDRMLKTKNVRQLHTGATKIIVLRDEDRAQ